MVLNKLIRERQPLNPNRLKDDKIIILLVITSI